jgi:3-oxoacyl-[acyl-carrier protein] reductase
MNLTEAKVLVTGGSAGIGLATAKMLVEQGAKVAICGRNADRVAEAAASIGAFPIVADVSHETDVVRMIGQVIEEFGDYNVLINNAGYGYMDSLVNMDLKQFNDCFATNVTGAMLCARESTKHFIEKQTGNIINISSSAGRKGYAGGTCYSATKFALSSMTECWRAELREHNIRVMQVNPSEVQTAFFSKMGHEREENPNKLYSEDIAHSIVSLLEMNDRGFTTEVSIWATNPNRG